MHSSTSNGHPHEIGLSAHSPRLVFWEATAGCNLECRHCRRLEVAKALSRRDLKLEQVKKYLIDGILEVGKPVLVFSGGEPLMRGDIFELGGYARDRGLPIALATNGTLVDDKLADKIVETGFERVAISLDGGDPATHDAFRQQEGAYDGAVRGINKLRARGISIQVNSTVTLHNIKELSSLYNRVIDLGAEAWHVFMFVPVGCGLTIPEDQQLAAEQYEEVLQWLAQRSMEKNIFVRATCAPQFYRILAKNHALKQFQQGSKFATMTKGCLAGTGICFISHTGEVFPCGYLPVSSGNITQQSFSDIWNQSPIFEALRDPGKLEGKCGACEFKQLCSGCRARAYASSGNYLTEEPCCTYTPKAQAPQILN